MEGIARQRVSPGGGHHHASRGHTLPGGLSAEDLRQHSCGEAPARWHHTADLRGLDELPTGSLCVECRPGAAPASCPTRPSPALPSSCSGRGLGTKVSSPSKPPFSSLRPTGSWAPGPAGGGRALRMEKTLFVPLGGHRRGCGGAAQVVSGRAGLLLLPLQAGFLGVPPSAPASAPFRFS